jgi:acyl-CoA dehydrogenase
LDKEPFACHPYVFAEMESIRLGDLKAFDKAFWSHIGFYWANLSKSIFYAFTDGHLLKATAEFKRYYQLLLRYSTNLAYIADFAMISLGADLKRREKISARIGDILSYLYLTSAVLKRFDHDGNPQSDKPFVDWCCQQLFYKTEEAMEELVFNFPAKCARFYLKLTLLPMRRRHKPSDRLGSQVAKILLIPNTTRSKLIHLVFAQSTENCPVGRLEEAFNSVCINKDLERKVLYAFKEGRLKALTFLNQIDEALGLEILTPEEVNQLKTMEHLREQIIAVDDFSQDELARKVDLKVNVSSTPAVLSA